MKILIIGPYGIGNSIICLPMVKELRKKFKDARIDVLTLLGSTRELLNEVDDFSRLFNNIYYVKDPGTILSLRKEKYDCSITAFPSARPHYNILSFIIGASMRIGSVYPDNNLFRVSFFNTVNVPVVIGIHDVYQNINLLQSFGVNYTKVSDKMNQSILALKKKRKVIGFHTGSKKEGSFKRWGNANFIELIRLISSQYKKYRIRLFFGPHEEEDVHYFVQKLKGLPVEVVTNRTIKEIIKEINECRVFISNDSGLMHLAAFLGCYSVSIMGPSDFRRTGPFTRNKVIVYSDIACRPCSHTYTISSHRFECLYETRRCLEEVKPQEVFLKVQKELR
ncbi:MAG: glycosyltransferase family 9 protein [Spirochaetes bacterium]|nr:glycosyltransferase family 9 protein [Spirochaetota bacterium]